MLKCASRGGSEVPVLLPCSSRLPGESRVPRELRRTEAEAAALSLEKLEDNPNLPDLVIFHKGLLL